MQLEAKWSPGNQQLVTESFNRPVTLKSAGKPSFTFRYTKGLRNVFGGDYDFQKFTLNVIQTVKTGQFGRGKYSFTLGYIPSTVPYPLLENHLGNQTVIYNPNAYNLMHFFEFVSDKYVSINYTQHFEGFILNSIPVINKLNWRLVGTANILHGTLSPANEKELQNASAVGLKGFGATPYMEASYGVENIFRFLRVDFIHRLTYRGLQPNSYYHQRNFGIKFSAQLRF